MTAEQRSAFERDGYLIIRGALCTDEVAAVRDAIDRTYAAMARAGSLDPDGSMHLLSAVANCPEVAGLIDHPATFGYVWSTLGWNIHACHSHVDVHPPVRVTVPFRFEWHQDGGRQNREIETIPRPRLSVKLAYWLSDVSEPGRGNLKVVPGSHLVNRIDGPPRRDIEWPDPEGAAEVTAELAMPCSSTAGSGTPGHSTTRSTPARRSSSATPTGGPLSATHSPRSGPAASSAGSPRFSSSCSAVPRTPAGTTHGATTRRQPRCTAG
jgi:hypothetical protein